jgi:hypothetical protein
MLVQASGVSLTPYQCRGRPRAAHHGGIPLRPILLIADLVLLCSKPPTSNMGRREYDNTPKSFVLTDYSPKSLKTSLYTMSKKVLPPIGNKCRQFCTSLV